MPLKDFIDNHPLTALVSAAIATASVVAATVGYLAEKQLDIEKKSLNIEYSEQINGLKTRLTSIERRIGDGEKTYFDISKILIVDEGIKSLPQSYKSADSGKFYYNNPSGNNWTHEKSSETNLMSISTGLEYPYKSEIADEENVELWRLGPEVVVYPKSKPGLERFSPKFIKAFPFVAVQVLNISALNRDVGKIFDDNDRDKEIEDAAKKIIQINRESEDNPDKKIKMSDSIDGLFRADITAVFLMGFIQAAMGQQQIFENCQSKILSTQKKGNVLYIQTVTKFKNIDIGNSKTLENFSVEKELFVFSNATDVYVVTVNVPSIDGRSEAFAWVAEWLSGLRIPL